MDAGGRATREAKAEIYNEEVSNSGAKIEGHDFFRGSLGGSGRIVWEKCSIEGVSTLA